MRKAICAGLLFASMLSPYFSRPLSAEGAKPASAPAMPKVGEVAPDFKLQYFDGTDLKDVTLSQYRGQKNVVLAFYIFAFTGG